MGFRRFFNTYQPKRGPGTAVARAEGDPATGDQGEVASGVFMTPQTLATFPGATIAVSVIWRIAGAIVPAAQEALVVPLVASLVVGGIIYCIGYTDPKAALSPRDRKVGLVVALLNSLYLCASVTGLLKSQ